VPSTRLVTGGAGFVGSALVRRHIEHTDRHAVVVRALTVAGNGNGRCPLRLVDEASV